MSPPKHKSTSKLAQTDPFKKGFAPPQHQHIIPIFPMEPPPPPTTNNSVLMLPWLAHGHVSPYLELAKNLAKKNFEVYFCSTPVNLTSIRDAVADAADDSLASIHLVELRLPSTTDLPEKYHTTKNLPPHLFPKLLEALSMSKSSFFDVLSSLRPNLLVYDVFQTWAVEQAASLGVTPIHFATTGAATYAFSCHKTYEESPFPYEAMFLRDYERRAIEATTAAFRGLFSEGNNFIHFTLSHDVVLMKTCRAFEGKYVDHLSDLLKKRVVPVGALVKPPEDDEENLSYTEIVDWLEKKTPSSTVFISLGSENYFTRPQLTEMAKGLEKSGVNFIWVIRFPDGEEVSGVEEVLPPGFLEAVKGRGLILDKWAPQARILGHPSTGAFLSHCGASSLIESIYYGVPIVALPLTVDQPTNARLVVECGVGLEIERDENGDFDGGSVSKAISEVILGEKGGDLRVKVAEISEKMKGEQEPAMNEAAQVLMELCKKKQQQQQQNQSKN